MRVRASLRLFWEFAKIATFVVGGGYAILAAAEDVFSRRLKWTREGELLDALPIFQMVPGLIAGNCAIYVGRKVAGLAGSVAALVGVALPSFCAILAIAAGYDALPMENIRLQGAFLGLRSALAGVTAALVAASWKRSIAGSGPYPPVALAAGLVLTLWFGVSPAWVLLGGMAAGIFREAVFRRAARGGGEEDGRTPQGAIFKGLGLPAAAAVALCALDRHVFLLFSKFGLLCFGGGMVLVPVYVADFVGPSARWLQLPPEQFGNLLAITQMTPGPVSVNAATFFGYRLAGVVGSVAATAGLLAPSLFLLTVALRSLDKWRRSAVVRGILDGVAPMTVCLMVVATWIFAKMSCISVSPPAFRPVSAALAAASCALMLGRKAGVMALVVCGAAAGGLFPSVLGVCVGP